MASTDQNMMAKIRLTAPVAGHRISRLGLELYLVEYLTSQGYSVAEAGLVYLVFNVVGLVSGVVNLWLPEMAFGSLVPAVVFFVTTATMAVVGFVGLFLSNSMPVILFCAALSGIGQKLWLAAYQTAINKTDAMQSMSTLAQLRQGFECIGFLLPSIVLAIMDAAEETAAKNIIRFSVVILGCIATFFHLMGADIIIRKASSQIERETTFFACDESIFATAKRFLKSWALVLNILVASLLCIAALCFGTASVVTEEIFRLESTNLWLLSVGFPIGGIASVVVSISKKKHKPSDYSMVKTNGLGLLAVLMITLVAASLATVHGKDNANDKEWSPVFFLVLYGLALGFFFSGMFTGATAIWLKELHSYDAVFVSRSHIFLECIFSSLVLAIGFQLHTLFIDMALNMETPTQFITVMALLGPIIVLLIFCLLILAMLPPIGDPKFDLPYRLPKTSYYTLRFLHWIGGPVDEVMFGKFCSMRSEALAQQLDIENINWAGPLPKETMELTPNGFAEHLKAFQTQANDSKDQCFFSDSVSIDSFLFENEASLCKREELIAQATKSIFIFTWSLDEHVAFSLADQLITKKEQGIMVRVVVDAINLYFVSELHDKFHSKSSPSVKVIKKLLNAGVEVRMLDKRTDVTGSRLKPIVAGTHRKIMLVDDQWLLTGGRNIEDKYLCSEKSSDCHRFLDLDVVLSRDFSQTTSLLLDSLWIKARSTEIIFSEPGAIPDEKHEMGHKAFEQGNSVWINESESRKTIFLRRTLAPEHTCSSLLDDTEEGQELDTSQKLETTTGATMPVSLFELDHKSGDPTGKDIIFCSLIFLIEKATETIDLWFGYCTLYPELEASIARALARGVKIRLITNSNRSNDLYFYTKVFNKTLTWMLEHGVEVYVPKLKEEEGSLSNCLHSKALVADRKVVMIGSWNLICASTLHDAEYSVVLFGNEDSFLAFGDYFNESIGNGTIQRIMEPPSPWELPSWQKLFITKEAVRVSELGY